MREYFIVPAHLYNNCTQMKPVQVTDRVEHPDVAKETLLNKTYEKRDHVMNEPISTELMLKLFNQINNKYRTAIGDTKKRRLEEDNSNTDFIISTLPASIRDRAHGLVGAIKALPNIEITPSGKVINNSVGLEVFFSDLARTMLNQTKKLDKNTVLFIDSISSRIPSEFIKNRNLTRGGRAAWLSYGDLP